jgi:hypothetical protein
MTMVCKYNYYNFRHYHRPVLYKNVLETGFCLRLRVEPTQMGPIERASLWFRTTTTTTSWGWSWITTDGKPVSLSWFWVIIWNPWPNFFLCDDCTFLDVEQPLWRKDGSVIYWYNCFWALPEQSPSRPSPAELRAVFYYLLRLPNLEAQVPIFISHRNRATQFYLRALGSFLSPTAEVF